VGRRGGSNAAWVCQRPWPPMGRAELRGAAAPRRAFERRRASRRRADQIIGRLRFPGLPKAGVRVELVVQAGRADRAIRNVLPSVGRLEDRGTIATYPFS
jgi:hypothetical protein